MEIIIGVGAGVTLIGGLIVILSFIGERPKRQEVQNMIDRSITSIIIGIDDIKDNQKTTHKALTELSQNISKVCPYGILHSKSIKESE